MRLKHLPALFVLILLIGLYNNPVKANVYPFDIHISQPGSEDPFDGNFLDGTAAEIHFMLQDTVQASDVAVKIKSGSTVVRTINLNIKGGFHTVPFDGRDDNGDPLPVGSYTIEITASQATGHNAYTIIYNAGSDAAGISTRGVTVLTNPAWRNFGFAYGVTTPGGGAWNFTGVGRVGSNGLLYGDVLGNAQLTTTGEQLGPSDKRYDPVTDEDGYIYVIGRTAKEIYRFHPDSLVVTKLIDTIPTSGLLNGICVVGSGANRYLYIASTTAILGAAIGNSAVYSGTVDSLIGGDASTFFWGVTAGDGGALYATYNATGGTASGSAGQSGVLKFNMPTPTPQTLANAVWKFPFESGDAVSMDIWRGATDAATDDILYVTADQTGNEDGAGGIYTLTNLTAAAPTRTLAFADLQGNGSRTRSKAAVDYAGNLIYFENSNEEILIISPPSGPNSATITAIDPFMIDVPVPVELSSFAAQVAGSKVTLSWSTATESNNRGFEIERKAVDGEFRTIGFIDGKGTTTEAQKYSFIDENVSEMKYVYRLKQIDLDGTFSYSQEVEVDVVLPKSFSLEQNFPNPFNPVTTIRFNIPAESNVTLKIFNTLGEEVATLLNNEMMQAGTDRKSVV